ncbi:MAG TPA: hypothetical protein PK950_01595, partial [Candidatus Paceibacterota bacterium]|nr:hypothetical protein [Candidatus Paceibacterota bacterium]
MKKILAILGVVLVAIVGLYRMSLPYGTSLADLFGPTEKSYSTSAMCTAQTQLPCAFHHVGDFGQIWQPSPHRTKEACDKESGGTGVYECIVPNGMYSEERWIPRVDITRARYEEVSYSEIKTAKVGEIFTLTLGDLIRVHPTLVVKMVKVQKTTFCGDDVMGCPDGVNLELLRGAEEGFPQIEEFTLSVPHLPYSLGQNSISIYKKI